VSGRSGRGPLGRVPIGIPRADLPAWRRWLRYHLARVVVSVVARSILRLRLEGREHLVDGPAMYCFNHLNWADPPLLLAAFPSSVRLYFYGPKEETLRRGARNRIMWWAGIAVPFKPGKDDLLTSVKRAQAVFTSGASLAIAGEGAIHVHEGDLLPLHEGAAYLALRAGVPIVPVAITGTSWMGFRRLVRVRIGTPIPTGERPTHEAIEAYTWRTWHALRAMVADDRNPPIPGRFGRWFTDVFNDWGPGGRAAAGEVRGPEPSQAPLPPEASPAEAAGASGASPAEPTPAPAG
jgi:1-acyl-sn-glycerol-3-phosphate acyltransferase